MIVEDIEVIVLSSLLHNEPFVRRAFPFLKSQYFKDQNNKFVFDAICEHIEKYKSSPTQKSLLVDVNDLDIMEQQFDDVKGLIENLNPLDVNFDWLVDNTQIFCQEMAVHNAIMSSIDILEERDDQRTKHAIPDMLKDALGVSFDTNIGHDYIDDYMERYDSYTSNVRKIPFDLKYLNEITRGGVAPGTLNMFLAGTNVGKTLSLCHCAAANISAGYNVLYISMEIDEYEVGKRIDSNLLNVTMNQLEDVPRELYAQKVDRLKNNVKGKLIIKQYPTSQAGAQHFRVLLQELELKKKFVPDIIYVDYLNICMPSRKVMDNNLYSRGKLIAEDLRALAVEFGVPVFSATQVTRDGYAASDIDMTATAESWGVPQTLDWMGALITNDELAELGQYLLIELKTRYNDNTKHRKGIIGVDRAYQRLYDVDPSAQTMVDKSDTKTMDVDDSPLFDKTTVGKKDKFNKLIV